MNKYKSCLRYLAIFICSGQLPPYTLLRRVSYRFSQLSLTEKIIFNLSRKAEETEEDDDE